MSHTRPLRKIGCALGTCIALGCQTGADVSPEGSGEATAGFVAEPIIAAQVASAETVAALLDGETFEQVEARMSAEKPAIVEAQAALLAARYDMSDQPSNSSMTRGKPVQQGVRVRLADGLTWEQLAQLTPEQIKAQDLFPRGFMPLPHPNHPEGGMLFPKFHIDETLGQTGRDLERFDLDYDLPDHLLPEFPPAIFLSTRPDAGDVSQGELVTTHNYYRLFKDLLNPKQLDGLRLLVTPFAQQQFNLTDDRRSHDPSLGVACLDCHVNGHTNAATHLVGDIRPQELRNRIDTPPLRGLNIQRSFGSQRALTSVEDFTEFEQRAAYFDGDIEKAALKGVNILDRGSEVHHMAEMEKLFDFPPTEKLDPFGKLNSLANEQELRGEALFFGKARCGDCHSGAFFTDNSMHDLGLQRFFEARMEGGMIADGFDGPIKTFTLRGIKESPPYLHDGRLLTLADTVEFFNLVLALSLTAQEKQDLVAYMLAL